jgi:hypothetical protein
VYSVLNYVVCKNAHWLLILVHHLILARTFCSSLRYVYRVLNYVVYMSAHLLLILVHHLILARTFCSSLWCVYRVLNYVVCKNAHALIILVIIACFWANVHGLYIYAQMHWWHTDAQVHGSHVYTQSAWIVSTCASALMTYWRTYIHVQASIHTCTHKKICTIISPSSARK